MNAFPVCRTWNPARTAILACSSLLALCCCGVIAAGAQLPVWPGYAGNAQHTALSAIAAQSLQSIHWHTPIDLINQNTTGEILIHYGSPLITAKNTVIVTVRTSSKDTFVIEGHGGYSGELKWSLPTDYVLPPHSWTPSCGSTFDPNSTLYVPAAGGTLLQVFNVDRTSVYTKRLAFYGLSQYNNNSTTFNKTVYVDTPITCDKAGNLYFGFQVTGTNPAGLQGGLARIGANGVGTWVSAATASGDSSMDKVTLNCAPAISNDGRYVYVAVNTSKTDGNGALPGYLLVLDSLTLKTVGQMRLKDVKSGKDANVIDDGTATPTIGPDDDVYFGVLEIPWYSNGDRGWLLHFDKLLTTAKTPGAFGWDDSAAIVPASAVPSYTGASSYLLLTKYNNYADSGLGGDGKNRVAVLDPGSGPNATMTDPRSGATVMNEVISVLGVTPDTQSGFPAGAVREWCINTAAIDPQTKSAVINSEDGALYRWDFTTNSLLQKVVLTPGVGEAYTPTVIGPDGTAYAINDAVLFAVGASAPDVSNAVRVDRYTMRRGATTDIRIQTVKVTNISGCKLTGPISLVLDSLTRSATLVNAVGKTANAAPLGSPYVTVSNGDMNAGDSVTLTLTFHNPLVNGPVVYRPRTLSGPGAP